MSFSFTAGNRNNNYDRRGRGRNVRLPNPFLPGPQGTHARIGYIVVGVLWLIVFNFLLSFNAAEAKAMTASTTGVVTAVQVHDSHSSTTSGSSRNSRTCLLTARFTVAGKTYSNPAATETSGDCSNGVGSSVSIAYNPSNPSSWELPGDKSAYGFITFIDIAVGVILIGVGVLGSLLQVGAIAAGLGALLPRRQR